MSTNRRGRRGSFYADACNDPPKTGKHRGRDWLWEQRLYLRDSHPPQMCTSLADSENRCRTITEKHGQRNVFHESAGITEEPSPGQSFTRMSSNPCLNLTVQYVINP